MDDLQRFGDASLAHGAQAVQESAADVGATRSQSPGFEHILSATDAAVHVYLDLRAHGVHDGRQRPDRGLRAVELPPAVVGDDQGVGAARHG